MPGRASGYLRIWGALRREGGCGVRESEKAVCVPSIAWKVAAADARPAGGSTSRASRKGRRSQTGPTLSGGSMDSCRCLRRTGGRFAC